MLASAVDAGLPILTEVVAAPDPFLPEAARVVAVAVEIASRVRDSIAADAFPIVLAGDCNSCLGTVAGCDPAGLGVVWLDAHADVDVPDDSLTGSLDAMGLAMLTGRGWRALREAHLWHAPVDEQRVLLIGARNVEPRQRARLEGSRIRTLAAEEVSAGELGPSLDALVTAGRRVYLHVDLDALDPSEGIANRYAAPEGLTCDELLAAIDDVFDRCAVAAAALTAYEPEADVDRRMAATAKRVLEALIGRATRR